MNQTDVLEFYNDMKNMGVKVWIDGGWGVDALLGRQTREHKDLDIAIEEKDVKKMRQYLNQQNYKEINLEQAKPHNFVLADNAGHQIDVHVIVIDENGNGIYGPKENGQMYPASSLKGEGQIGGQEVKCISPEDMVKFHSGYELKEKDYKDVKAICERFGIPLPDEYRAFE